MTSGHNAFIYSQVSNSGSVSTWTVRRAPPTLRELCGLPGLIDVDLCAAGLSQRGRHGSGRRVGAVGANGANEYAPEVGQMARRVCPLLGLSFRQGEGCQAEGRLSRCEPETTCGAARPARPGTLSSSLGSFAGICHLLFTLSNEKVCAAPDLRAR